MAVGIQDVIAAIDPLTTEVASTGALLDRLSQMLKDAIATNNPALVQQAVDAIGANRQALIDAALRNTPADPTA